MIISSKEFPRTLAPPSTADYMIPRLNKITLPEQQTAGQLRHFMSNWKIITSDESVLETVGGYRIPLTSKPHQWRKRITKVKSLQQELLLTQAISDLVSIGPEGCILLCSDRRGTPEIPSISVSRCTYEYQCLPFGLSSAPRAFAKLVKPVITILRISGIQVVIYLYNLLLFHQDPAELQKIFKIVITLFTDLRFVIKLEVLTLAHASNHLSGCTAELARPYNSCSSGETLPHTIGVQRDPDQGVVLHAGTLGTAGLDESDCTDWDLGSTIALPSSSTNIHCSPAQERSLHTIKAVPDFPNKGSILRTQMVVFGETESNQLDGVEPPPPPPGNRRNNIDVIIST